MVRSLLSGHFWTIGPVAASLMRRPALAPGAPWQTVVDDPEVGRVRLSGRLHTRGSDTIVVAIHGLGGDIDSHYMRRAAEAALLAGFDVLRLNLRGADLSGEDYYHAGLTADLHASLASPALAGYRRILAIGYSLGGHLLLRGATELHDPRLAAVAAICPPLDLELAVRDMDRRRRFPYRYYVMSSLKAMIRATARRRALPLPLDEVMALSSVRAWDQKLVAPRFGFATPAEYYQRMSVAPRLGELAIPTLLIAATHDPMVLAPSLRASLAVIGASLEVRWLDRAGHVGFPPDVDLGQRAPLGLEPQTIAWLASAG
jgi:uncharacterized protein